MRRFLFASLLFSVILFVSCQKEIDWGLGGGGGGGSTSGDLLVKALQITPATNDTNVIVFQWDGNKHLLAYKSSGKVNGTAIDLNYTISRLSDGKISKILSTTSLTSFSDSTVYIPTYQAGSSHLLYVIDTQYTMVGTVVDSSAFVYNAGGLATSKETFISFFGLVTPSGKETYAYDANGNVTTITEFSPDGSGGYTEAGTSTYTYDSHKNAVILGEESYIVLGASNVSKNNATTTATTSGGTGYTGTFSQQQFNSFDRPTQSSLTLTPKPPGYDLKLLYYYQ